VSLDAPGNEEIGIFTFGIIIGVSASSPRWEEAIWDLSRRIDYAVRNLKSPMKLNVYFKFLETFSNPNSVEFAPVRTQKN